MPFAFGQARVEAAARGRSVYVYGSTTACSRPGTSGRAGQLPAADRPHRRGSFVVLGPKLARELFGDASPLGQRVRIGSLGFLVIGVLEPKGQFLGFDMDDSAYVPVGDGARPLQPERADGDRRARGDDGTGCRPSSSGSGRC